MYFDFEDGHPDYEPVGSALSFREGVLLSIIVHLVAALILVLLPETEWYRARLAAAEAAADAKRQEALEQRRSEQRRFVFVQPRVELEPRTPPPPRAPLSDRDRTAVTREAPPRPTNPQPFSRGNTPEFVEPSPPPSPPAAGSPAPPSPAEMPAQAANRTPGSESALRLPEAADRPAFRREAEGQSSSGATPEGRPLREAIRNLSRYAERQAFENPTGGDTGSFGPFIQFDTKGVEFGPWIRRFVAQVKRNWFVPDSAMFLKGHVVITFNVHKTGAITDLTVVGPSSVESFNNAAFNALAASNPTEPLPPEYPADQAFFTVTFYYNEVPPQAP